MSIQLKVSKEWALYTRSNILVLAKWKWHTSVTAALISEIALIDPGLFLLS